ncbi:MAG TPA: ABC transporter permease [Candidatus Limnocylindrales bacterium]|nr:ABC transporter permease [Candidatus Limnocylindrales bacterium]
MKLLQQMFRRLGRTPVFSVVAVITLALGIAGNTAVFSVIEGVLLKPLPYPDAGQLAVVWHSAPGIPGVGDDGECAPTMLFTYRELNHSFQDFGLWDTTRLTVTGSGEAEQAAGVDVSYGVFQALGVPPEVGRWFSQADDSPGTPKTAIVSYGYWQRHFGGLRSVLGQRLMVDSEPRTIVGVMPQRFRFLDQKADIFLPFQFDRNKLFLGNFSYNGMARLKPGVTIEMANADVRRIIPVWLQAWPPPPGFSKSIFENARLAPNIKPLKAQVVGDIGSTLWVLMGTLAMVLLIACANVANLLLVRAEGRQQELAIRAALGANWMALARELLLESMTLSVLGGALGLALAYAGLQLLVAKGPATLPRLSEIGIDPWVLAFTAAVSLISGLLFGLMPVIKYAGPKVSEALRSGGGRTMSDSRERHRTRDVLVVVQVALALVLLIGSGLMIRTSQKLFAVQPGFQDPEHVQLIRISIPEAQVKDDEAVMRMQNNILDALGRMGGVKSVSLTSSAPMQPYRSGDVLFAQDKGNGAEDVTPLRQYRFVAPGYWRTTGIPLVAGRDFDWDDLYQLRNVVIVSENLAREWWGSASAALGKRVREGSRDPWREVIGVAGNVYDSGTRLKPPTMAYWPALMSNFWGEPQRSTRTATFVLRTPRAGTQGLIDEARKAIWSVNESLPLYEVRTLDDIYRNKMARTSFALTLLAIAGAMALVLGIVGIYGIIAYAVSHRRREIGIRIALGAPAASVQGMFLGRGLMLAGIGSGIGLAAAALATRAMTSVLFEVQPVDAPTYAAAAIVLMVSAAAAGYVPARRATGVDPVNTLRAE